jgi:short-subunit dehydrogenase
MLDGKVALVTGASSGIGAALSLLLAREKANVVLTARRANKLGEIARHIEEKGGRCLVLPCDITKRLDAERLIHQTVEEFGRIDILVNNAGRGHFSSVEDTTDEIIQKMFALNVFPLWYTTRPSLTYMKKQGNGHIINVASMAGKLGFPYNSAYVAAKHACVGFTHALRQELVETCVCATVVCPAGVSTEWAIATEGGSMQAFFSESGRHIKRIASERSISLPAIEGLKTADSVAAAILDCIYHPVPEVFTHTGSKEFVLLATQNREQAEYHQLPIVLGEREVYRKIKGSSGDQSMNAN